MAAQLPYESCADIGQQTGKNNKAMLKNWEKFLQVRCISYFRTLWQFPMFTAPLFQIKLHSLCAVLVSGFQSSRELWNPLSTAVPGKFLGSGWHSKCNCLHERANCRRSWVWQIVLIFNTEKHNLLVPLPQLLDTKHLMNKIVFAVVIGISSILTLYVLHFSEGTKTHTVFTLYVIPPHWHDTDSWNPSSSKTRTHIFHSQYHGCWCPDDARSQAISNHAIYYVEPDWFSPHTLRVNHNLQGHYTDTRTIIPSTSLWDTITPGLQDSKGTLISHTEETT